jgi:uncharacterized membrane protein YphA (DoxX/SURF4 family)/uncharacterized membrane protein
MHFASILLAVAIPPEVAWCYAVSAVVWVVGLCVIFLGGYWAKARGLEKLIIFGPLFYAVPIAAFGTEHFMIPKDIASMVPQFIPWHMFWTYFIGACFIAAGFSLAAKIQAQLAASLLGFTFFVFVTTMDIPGWLRTPHDRFVTALMLRELSFSSGALALAASLTTHWRERQTHILATWARYTMAVTILFYSFEQFLHADHVPALPLELVTPDRILMHALWTYLTAAVFVVTGIMLLVGTKTRLAAAVTGLSILIVEFVVYIPIAWWERASLEGINYLYDTLMYCGAVLMLAAAMPQQTKPEVHP